MSDTKSITAIKQEEEAAGKAIYKAKEAALKDKEAVDSKYEVELANAAQGLNKEMTEIQERVQTEAITFKNGVASDTKEKLAITEEGKAGRIGKAKDLVVKSFQSYVSK